MSRLFLRLLLCGLAALAALTAGAPSALARAESPRIDVRAPAQVKIGQRFSVVLRLAGPARASGYEASLLYDRSALEFSGSFQGGRELGPIDLATGEAIGAYAARSNTAVLGGRHTVRLMFVAHHRGTVNLRLAGTRVVDFAGHAIPISRGTRSLSIRVEGYGPRKIFAAPPAALSHRGKTSASRVRDVTHDRVVDRSDLDEVAMDWQTARMDNRICGDKYVPGGADANGDGCLDVADVQSFARGTAHPHGMRRSASASLFKSLAGGAFTVDSTGDGEDANPGDGLCQTPSATCTLRAAITETNALSGPNTINFLIPGTGVRTIQLTSQLPNISDTSGATTIDGYSQPGAVPNTDQYASNAQIKVEVRGQGSNTFDGLRITSANNVIKGLAFYNLRQSIWMQSGGGGATGNSIQGNFIGTNAAGTFGFSAYVIDATGVEVREGASGNHIGEPTLAGRNVIAGNARHGIACYHGTNTLVYNNIVGLSPDGGRRLMNVKLGMDWNSNCADNVIGGTGPLQRNIVSGNGDPDIFTDFLSGVEISHAPGNTRNQVIGNCFGTDVTCSSAPSYAFNADADINIEDTPTFNVISNNVVAQGRLAGIRIEANGSDNNVVTNNWIGISPSGANLGPTLYGVRITNGAKRNTIGPGNVIANNNVGVSVVNTDATHQSLRNTITRNSVYANTALGIDLNQDGVTPNDPGDTDTGPNQLLNFPVITSATLTRVTGTACGGCKVEAFVADGDSSGYGEGKTYLGTATATANGGSFSIDITGVTAGQKVTTTATASAGDTSEFSQNMTVANITATLPGAPTLNNATAGDGSVALQWSPPSSDGGASITNYKVYRGTTSGGETLLTTLGNVTSYTDSTVQNGTTYFYKASAVNSVGEGSRSNELAATPSAPTAFVSDDFNRTVASGFGAAPVGGPWSVNTSAKTKVGNGQGIIYNWTGGNQDVQAWIPTTRTDMDLLGLVKLNASNPVGANYQARLMGRAQTDARNGYSAAITHTTSGSVTWRLSRVDNGGGTGTLTLSSGTLLASGGAGTSWWIRLRLIGTSVSVKFWQDGTTEPAAWTSQKTDGYWASGYVALGAFTSSGLSAPFPAIGFDSVQAVTPGGSGPTVPGPPTLSNATAGNASVALQWSPPGSDGGSSVTNYNIYRGTATGGETLLTIVGNVGSYTDSTAQNGTTYYYDVSAANSVGEGVLSSELSATPVTVPGAPTLDNATAGNASVALQWSAPGSDGGDALTSYKIYRGTSSGSETLLDTTGSETDYLDSTAQNGTTYYYEVSAVNSVGEGAFSNELSATPQPTVPEPPTLSSAAAGNDSVALQWTSEGSDGGSPVTNYKIYRGTSSGAETLLDTVGNVNSYDDSTAQNGTTYYYEVSAVNSVGEGAFSNELSATPQATVPGAPTLDSATPGNASVALQWSAPGSDGGSQVTNYRIYRGTSSGGETLLDTVGAVSSYTDSTAQNGTTYFYEVSAVNSAGEGALSNELSAKPATVPAAPTLNSATPGNASVALQWSAPGSNGGSPVTNYEIYRGTSSGGETLLTTLGNVTSYTDSTVQNGTTYFYEVSAVNSAGEGALSNELSAKPAAPTVFVNDDFNRTVASGFGTAPVGGLWSVNTSSRTKVENGQGVIYNWSGGNQDVRAWIPTVRTDSELVGLVKLNATNPVGANYQARLMSRAQTDARNGYAAVLTHTTSGSVTWRLSRVDNAGGTGSLTLSSGTLLGSGGAGSSWWIRLRLVGTSISVKFWQDGTTEPAAWTSQKTDSYWASGYVALGAFTSSGLSTPFPSIRFDNLTVIKPN